MRTAREVRDLARHATRRSARLPPLVRAVMALVASDLGKRLTLQQLGQTVNRSPSHLNVLFLRATGLTIREYTLYLRMTSAAQEIRRGVKIEAVAMGVGFRSRKNFYRQFETWFGVTPTDFRAARAGAASLRA